MDLSRTFLDWTKCQKERDKILRRLLIGTYLSSVITSWDHYPGPFSISDSIHAEKKL